MQGKKQIVRALLGFGLAGALFTGCQDFFGQQADDTPAAAADNQAPAELALKLSIKDSGGCLELRNQIEAIKGGAAVDAELIAKFANQCVEEAKGQSSEHHDLDDQVRCRWILSQIEGGREELVVKFRYYCPDSCETMVMEDSTEHAKVCREPKPEEKPSCEELKKRLAGMDTTTEEYARLRHFVREICEEPKPLPTPEEDTCRIIREKLSKLVAGSDEYLTWKKIYLARCEEPKPDPVPPVTCDELRKKLAETDNPEDSARLATELAKRCPVPHPVPVPGPNCDSLRLMLHEADSGSEAYDRIYHMMAEKKCVLPEPHPVPVPVPLPHPNCDSLRAMLTKTDSGSEAYNKILHIMIEAKCKVPAPTPEPLPPTCDELRKLFAATTNPEDSARLAMELAKRCPVPVPLPHPNCDSLRAMLAKADSGSEAYNRILHAMIEAKCKVPAPTPEPLPLTCDQLRKLFAATTNPEDSARLAMELAKRCPVPVPLPHPNCDSLRAMLAKADSGSEAYNRILHAMSEAKCNVEPAPVPTPDPLPVTPNCDELRRKLAALDPNSADYAAVKEKLAKYCPEVK
jgi:hypothetical protein